MLLDLIKTADGTLISSSEKTTEILKKVAVGSGILVDFKPKRNYLFHKKAFALLNLVFQNQDRYDNLDDLLVEFKLKSGHYQEHISTKGNLMYIPKSISFAEMDQNEFEDLYQKFLDIAFKHFNFTVELENELIRFT